MSMNLIIILIFELILLSFTFHFFYPQFLLLHRLASDYREFLCREIALIHCFLTESLQMLLRQAIMFERAMNGCAKVCAIVGGGWRCHSSDVRPRPTISYTELRQHNVLPGAVEWTDGRRIAVTLGFSETAGGALVS